MFQQLSVVLRHHSFAESYHHARNHVAGIVAPKPSACMEDEHVESMGFAFSSDFPSGLIPIKPSSGPSSTPVLDYIVCARRIARRYSEEPALLNAQNNDLVTSVCAQQFNRRYFGASGAIRGHHRRYSTSVVEGPLRLCGIYHY